jgi:peptidyl-prolyl cis-trans isomerase D
LDGFDVTDPGAGFRHRPGIPAIARFEEEIGAMMRQMRQNTKIIMLVTALAFVALMVFEWGMDMSGQTAGGDIGRVGGTNVSVQAWQNTYRNLYDQVQRSQEEPISSQQNREIEDMAWDEIVNQILIQKELDRRGIRVSDEEIRQAARFSPPQEFRQAPEFQTDGQFDIQKYQDFLQQASRDPEFMMQLEQYYRDIIPRSKLLRQVTSGIYLSDAELWREFRDQNEQVEVSFVALDARRRIADERVEVTDREVRDHYRANREDFAVPARAQIRYTYVLKAPSAADTVASGERARSIRQEILDGAEFAELADLESADRASAREGGALGIVERGALAAALDEAVFSLPVGQLSEPIRTAAGYHLVEVLSRDGDEAEVRQIVIPIERSDDAEIRMLTRVDSLEAMGRNQPLEEAARAFDLPVLGGEITEDFDFLPGVGPASEGQDWAFVDREGPGAVSPVFENRDAFYMLEILRESPAGYLSLEDVRGEIEIELRLRKKLALAEEEARQLARELREGAATLEELAEREGLEVQTSGPFRRMDSAPGLGRANAAVGAAFGAAVGEVAGPVRLGERVIVMRVDGRVEADREAFEIQKEFLRAQLTQQVRQQRLEQWLDGLRETTRIQDRRAEYFRAAEAAEDRPQIPLAF